jgi:hypothetical protein
MKHQHRRRQADDLSDEAASRRPAAGRHQRSQDEGSQRKEMMERALPLSGLGKDSEEDDIAGLRVREDAEREPRKSVKEASRHAEQRGNQQRSFRSVNLDACPGQRLRCYGLHHHVRRSADISGRRAARPRQAAERGADA